MCFVLGNGWVFRRRLFGQTPPVRRGPDIDAARGHGADDADDAAEAAAMTDDVGDAADGASWGEAGTERRR